LLLQESRLALFLSTPDKVGFLMIKEKYLKAVIVLILVLCLAGILISTLQSPSLGISMFLIVLFSYFLLNRRYRRIISTNEHLVNFIITFILTIFGVYLGMALSKKQEREIENAQTINILKSISDDLSYSQEVAKEVYKDKLKLATDTNYIRNPFADTLAYPTFFDLYLKTESFWTKLDPQVLFFLTHFDKKIISSINNLNEIRNYRYPNPEDLLKENIDYFSRTIKLVNL